MTTFKYKYINKYKNKYDNKHRIQEKALQERL